MYDNTGPWISTLQHFGNLGYADMCTWLKLKNFNLRNPCPSNFELKTKDFCDGYFQEVTKASSNLEKVIFWQKISINGIVWLQFVRSFNMGTNFVYDSFNYASLIHEDIYHVFSTENCICEEILIPSTVNISKQFDVVRNDDRTPQPYTLYKIPEKVLDSNPEVHDQDLLGELKEKLTTIIVSGYLQHHSHIYGTVRWLATPVCKLHENKLTWYVDI